jgi:ACS family glucarate transporter-like MFS transporter
VMWMSARWGGAAAPLLVYLCLQVMPWRATFMAFALLGVVWAALFYVWFRDNPREHKSVNPAEAALLPAHSESQAAHFHAPWSKLWRSRTVWCLCGQYAALSYAWYFFVTWFPTYLLEARGFDMKQSALLAGTPLFLGGFGSMAAGAMAPWLARRLGSVSLARRGLGAAGMFLAALLLVVSTALQNPFHAVAAIAVVSFFNDLTIPGAWTACMDVGGRSVGTLGGAMNMMGNFGGFLSPIVIGHLVARSHQWTLCFYVTAAVYLVGGVFWLLLDPVTPLEEQVPDR